MVGIDCRKFLSEGACQGVHVSLGTWVTRFKGDIFYLYAGIFRYLCEAEGIIHFASVFLLFRTRAY